MKQRAFSLIETLIATAILVTITAAIVALSNSVIAGTIINADEAVMNRWGTEGLETVSKIRDDGVLNNQIWLEQARDANQYGWYLADSQAFTLTPTGLGNVISRQDVVNTGQELVSDQLRAYRLICIEAVGAESPVEDRNSPTALIRCNTTGQSGGFAVINDGDRNTPTSCDGNDVFCTNTVPSINSNTLHPINLIPAGNAVKVKSVLVWLDKDQYRANIFNTLLTNWRPSVQ